MDTFVVRLWDPAGAAPAAGPLRGTALHVASGDSTPFVGVEELLGFFATVRLRTSGKMRQPEGPEADGDMTTAG